MNANDDDKLRMEEQASRVARRAAEALRESRMLRSKESFAVPTWTGRSGAAGAPSSIHRKFGTTVNTKLTASSPNRSNGLSIGPSTGKALSSAELLARIRGTQERAIDDALEQDLDLASSSRERKGSIQETHRTSRSSNKLAVAQPEVLIRQLCTFIQQRGGRADSASITQHFKDRIQSKDLPLFKNLLKEIATLERGAEGTRWVLKPEYR